jgi:hypothetical protein
MGCSSCHDAGRRPPAVAPQPNASRPASFLGTGDLGRGIFGQFLCRAELGNAICVSYSGTRDDKVPPLGPIPPHHRSSALTITTAHLPAIVALIAGILILIMPRLLNFIVAIYLIVIGLVGLGLLRWLHM